MKHLKGEMDLRISQIELVSPKTLRECLELLASEKEGRILAGGTDAVVRMKEGKWRPSLWINIKRMTELRYIREVDGSIHIGPLTTHSDIIRSALLQKKADVLVQAARQVGAVHIQNMGTIGGNLGTASPAGDTLPALYVMDAKLELLSLQGNRRVRIQDFFTGPGKTILKKGEIIGSIIIKPMENNEIGIFEKLGPRKAQAISIVNVAITLRMRQPGRECIDGKIAFGSVAPTIIRAHQCEPLLSLAHLDEKRIQLIANEAGKEVMPISDIRASSTYRREMASALLKRGLYRLMRRWESR